MKNETLMNQALIDENALLKQRILELEKSEVERRRMEEALKASEIKYQTIFETTGTTMLMVEEDMTISLANDRFEGLTGYTRQEVEGKRKWTEFVERDDLEKMIVYHQLRRTETAFPMKSYEFRLVHRDGHLRHILLTVDLVPGTKISVASLMDITTRKQAEEALKESEEKYRLVVENAEEAILIAQDGMLKYFNPVTVRILGYSEEELLSKSFIEMVHPDDRKKLMAAHLKKMKGEEVQPVREFRVVSKDGSVKWADSNAVVISWNGKPATLNLITDITERKNAEKALDKSFTQLRAALGAAVQAIAVTVETKDPYTAGHQRRVADLARSIARDMNLPHDQIEGIRTAAVIHDLGKISVPAEILSKPTKLLDLEFSLIETHSQTGYDILKDIDFPWPVARMVLEHHERMNGSGYPNGLSGENLLIESRILMVADVVEAMASYRPYRPALGIHAALDEIMKNKGILYDPVVVDTCLRLFREKGYMLLD